MDLNLVTSARGLGLQVWRSAHTSFPAANYAKRFSLHSSLLGDMGLPGPLRALFRGRARGLGIKYALNL